MAKTQTAPTLSPESAQFLLDMVNGLSLSVGAPNFAEAAATLQIVRGELEAILSQPQQTSEKGQQDPAS